VKEGAKKKNAPSSSSEEIVPKKHHFLMKDEEENPWVDLETRLERRDKTFNDDPAIALTIKTGDLKKLQWMIEKGFPLNLNVKDADGMCYQATDLAEHCGHEDMISYVKELAANGPSRQKAMFFYNDQSAEVIIPNSTDDFMHFRGNICHVFGIDFSSHLRFHCKGDDEEAEIKWNKFREGRKFIVKAT